MTFRALALSFTVAGLTAGCGFLGIGDQSARFSLDAVCSQVLGLTLNTTGQVQEGCTKIEGGDRGVEGVEIAIAGDVVRITDWRAKDDGPGEYIGFTIESSGPVVYGVKAGERSFIGTATTWVHPDGTGGPEAQAISNITFCPDPDGDGEPGDDGDGGGGDDGDGGDGGGECPSDGGDDGPGDDTPGDDTPDEAGNGDDGDGDDDAGCPEGTELCGGGDGDGGDDGTGDDSTGDDGTGDDGTGDECVGEFCEG